MTTPGGFLDFFILEAGDYVDQLDAQLLGGDAGLDGEALQRVARALRGSATMARQSGLAEVAAAVERVGRALREQQLQWNPAIRGVLVSAIDDLKILLRNVRGWGAADDSRVRTRVDELTRYAPTRSATPIAAPTTAGHDSYLATEASNIGAGLELLATRPSDRDAATNVLRRVRALRGIASVKDHASLADVLEAAEQAAHPLELGEPTLSAERVALLGEAATVLRGVAASIRSGGALDQSSPELARFAAALDAMQARETGADRVIPIAALYYADGGPTIVETAPNPPTTPAERFRLEVVSQGEHLRRVVGDAREARDDLARERVRRELRQGLRALQQAAESFGEGEVAGIVASQAEQAVLLDPRALDTLDDIATLLAQPASGTSPMADRLRALQEGRRSGAVAAPAAPAAPPAPDASVPRMSTAPEFTRTTTPSRTLTPVIASPAIAPPSSLPQERDRPAAAAVADVASSVAGAAASGAAALMNLLDTGIRSLGTLRDTPLTAPVAIEEQPPVPIERLLYRGRAALERAREIRHEVTRESGGVDDEKLRELFDLLDLAST